MTGPTAKPNTKGKLDQTSDSPARISVLDSVLWAQMADSPNLPKALEAWLAIQSSMIKGVVQAVLVVSNKASDSKAKASYSLNAKWPSDSVVVKELTVTTELVLNKGVGIIRASDSSHFNANKNSSNQTASFSSASGVELPQSSIGYPLRIGKELYAAVAILIAESDSLDLKKAMRQLQFGAGWFETLILRDNTALSLTQTQHEKLSLSMMQAVLSEPDFYTACVAVVNELAVNLECERVSLGFIIKKSSKVIALSHTVQLDSKLNLLNAIAAAMDESLDQQSLIVYSGIDDSQSTFITRAQRNLVTEHQSGCVVSAPFKWRDRFAGAFTFEKAKDKSFSKSDILLCEHASVQLGSLLEERRLEQRWLGAKAAGFMATYLSKLLGEGQLTIKLVSLCFVFTALFLMFVTGDYRVSAPVYLKGEIQRVLATPFDGYIAGADYRAGDLVEKGAVIAYLDDRELNLEKLRWLTKKRQHLIEHDQALAEKKRAEMGVIRARISQAESQITLIEAQLERSKLRAPFDGVLISGDLSQSIGAAVRKGEMLFEIVPYDRYRVILKVDESEIKFLSEGQQGLLMLTALPEAKLPLVITMIGSVSSSDEGSNYFEVEGRLLEKETSRESFKALKFAELRPGMEGIAKVTTGERQLFWIWTHRFFDWIELQLWSLWP